MLVDGRVKSAVWAPGKNCSICAEVGSSPGIDKLGLARAGVRAEGGSAWVDGFGTLVNDG